jgi:hypothetical protein
MADTSIAGPALIRLGPGAGRFGHPELDGQFCMGWTGTDAAGLLNTALSQDGFVWDKTIIPTRDTSIAAPALAWHNAKLFLAWTGTDGAGELNVMASLDGGKTFVPESKHTLAETSVAAPALLSYAGLLVLAWTGTDGAATLNVAASGDEGASWQKIIMPEQAIGGPALTSWTSGAGFSTLFLAWTGTDNRLNARWCDGTSFDQFGTPEFHKQTLDETSNLGPSLASFTQPQTGDKYVAIAWTGREAAQRLNRMTSFEGFAPFGFKNTSDETSIATPAVMTYSNSFGPPDELVFAWTGTDGGGHLNFAPGPAIGLGLNL